MRTIEQPRISDGAVLRVRDCTNLILSHLRRVGEARTTAQIAEHVRAGNHWEDQGAPEVGKSLAYLEEVGLIRRVGDAWIAYRIRDLLK